MTAVEVVATLLLPAAVFVVVWPLVELRRRGSRHARQGHLSRSPR